MKTLTCSFIVASLLLSGWGEALGQQTDKYKRWNYAVKVGRELYNSLDTKYRAAIPANGVNLETDMTPFVRLEQIKGPDIPNPINSVFLSVGFFDLVNYVAHAKAIDKVKKGYFEKYILSLAQESGEKELREPPDLANSRYWQDDTMNEQLSNLNQIVAEVLAINFAHYYLGHYQKYAAQLADPQGKPVPISRLLTEKEWDEAIKYGVWNALNCGYGIDGVKALFDSIEKMPKRPSWTAYFLPETVKVSRLKKDMERIERDFFAGAKLK